MDPYSAPEEGDKPAQNLLDKEIQGHGHAADLLNALVGVIEPIIRAYTPPSISQTVRPGRGNPLPSLSAKEEGNALLQALEAFIVATMNTKMPAQATLLSHNEDVPGTEELLPSSRTEVGEGIEPGILTNPSHDTAIAATHASDIQPNQLAIREMREMIRTEAHTHVYNKMPIRLLAFGAAGADPSLVDRGEIHRRVLDRAYASMHAHVHAWPPPMLPPASLTKVDAGERRRQRQARAERMKAIISHLVADCARYAILSHTWIRDIPGDVVFQDWAARAANARGYRKISKFCEVAAANYDVCFGWMDTVCIDKTSSSELDESIRSMYRWYRNAHVCIAYLSQTVDVPNISHDSWFTRGWTLQELLAPQEIRFYNKDWQDFLRIVQSSGTRWTVKDIQDKIEEATTITSQELDLCRLGEAIKIPVSRKLWLAADRQVTRQEDKAYSVMGLLDVDISIAYGEGPERAFFRLIRELLSTKQNILDIFNHGTSPYLLPCRQCATAETVLGIYPRYFTTASQTPRIPCHLLRPC